MGLVYFSELGLRLLLLCGFCFFYRYVVLTQDVPLFRSSSVPSKQWDVQTKRCFI